MIEVKALRKGYGQGATRVEVLKGVDLSVQNGESVALVGKSGSGKSTLLSLMAGLDTADTGEIWIDKLDLGKMDQKSLTSFRAKNIGIVFQQFHLVSTLTALENILLPMELLKMDGASERAMKLIECVGLKDRSHHLPSQLSGGEGQRVAIARALAIKPKVLFADEPSGNLDEETGDKVMSLLFDLVRESGTTLVLVTHDKELAKRCSRAIHLEHGALL